MNNDDKDSPWYYGESRKIQSKEAKSKPSDTPRFKTAKDFSRFVREKLKQQQLKDKNE